jgi:hypothetical protein
MGNSEDNGWFEDLRVNGKIILKWILKVIE